MGTLADSAKPNQIPPNVAYNYGLYCLFAQILTQNEI